MKNKLSIRTILQRILSRLTEAHWSFFLLAFLFGGMLIALTPPFWGTDEASHFFRAYQISTGQFSQSTTIKNGYISGNQIPESFRELDTLKANDIKNLPLSNQPHQVGDIDRYFNIGSRIPSQEKSVLSPYGAIIYPVVAYTAPSSIMFVESVFHPSTLTLLYSARAATLIFYTLIVMLALFIARSSSVKWIIFLIALLPTSLYGASIVNADSVLLSSTLLFATCMFMLIRNHRIEKWNILLLAISAVLLTYTKPPYLVLVLPLIFLPLDTQIGQRERRIIKWAIPIVCVLVAIIAVLSLGNVIAGGAGSVSDIKPTEQIQWILHHPLGYVSMLINSTMIMNWVPQIIGIFGSSFIFIPGPMRQLLLVWLVLSIFFSIGKDEYKQENNKKMGYLNITAALVTSVAVISVLYLTWTPVGSSIVQGVQGRYFIPVLAFFLIGIRLIVRQRLTIENEWKLRVFNIGIVSFCLLGSIIFYYKTLYH